MRHIGILNKEWSQIFQSTHPLRDATPLISFDIAVFNDFNPRTPYGMRPHGNGHCLVFFLISIHAPLTGCDKNVRKNRTSEKNFNPRTPYGMRHNSFILLSTKSNFNPRTPYGMRLSRKTAINALQLIFQSTHPLRDATMERVLRVLADAISIHAPLTGCDSDRALITTCLHNFNPRTPYGMRHKFLQ